MAYPRIRRGKLCFTHDYYKIKIIVFLISLVLLYIIITYTISNIFTVLELGLSEIFTFLNECCCKLLYSNFALYLNTVTKPAKH